MQITPWTVYWITRADALHSVTGGAGALLILLFMFLAFATPLGAQFARDFDLGSEEEVKRFIVRLWKLWLAAASLAFLLHVGVPTTREAAAILVLPAIANNEDIQKMGSDIPKLAREWLKELQPEAEEAK